MKRAVIFSIIAVLLIIAIFVTVFITNSPTANSTGSDNQPFYVGVTFGGNTTSEAKLLIDKVKTYTNLFILQSGPLQKNVAAINEIGDYAVNSGLNLILYFGSDSSWLMKTWLDQYDGHWNASFLGTYFGDEPGGKMLDGEFHSYDDKTQSSLIKYVDGTIQGYKIDTNTSVTYKPDGTIITNPVNQPQSVSSTTESDTPPFPESYSFTTYYPNGTVTVTTQEIGNSQKVVENVSNALYTYEQLSSARPFQSIDETAQRFVKEYNSQIGRAKSYDPQFKFNFFTSDYALYWFDYQAGYNVMLAQFGWNQSTSQDIALVRGAANLQNKSWGAIITWKYTVPPYLASGDEIYQQMRMAYEGGAQYIAVFNYAEDMQGSYGTLQDEHFQALERFWNDVVQNPNVIHGGVKAEAALVLPRNYGWGMRNPSDTIWGLWSTNSTSEQIWTQLQSKLQQYGSKLDIVYDDPAHPVAGKYSHIYYWNQTS